MDLALLVYGITTLGNFKAFLAVLMVVCIGLSFGNILGMDSWVNEEKKALRWKWAKRWVIILVCLGALQVVLPSQKTAYTMVGAYAAQKVSENEKVQQMSGKVLTIIEQKLDGYIEEGIAEAKDRLKEKK